MTRLARILLPAALATLAIGACVPAPAFHGGSDGDAAPPPDAPPPGPLTVTVQSRDGSGHPSENAKVTVADPSGELRHDFTDAAGNVTLMAASGATVLVEDPALVGEQMLVAVFGAQPGDHLQIGAPQLFFPPSAAISIEASPQDPLDYFWATSPCGSAMSPVSAMSVDFALPIDDRCVASSFDVLFVTVDANTNVPTYAGLKHVSSTQTIIDFVGSTQPVLHVQVVYAGLDQLGDLVAHLVPLADGRRLYDFTAEASGFPGGATTTVVDNYWPSNDTLFEVTSLVVSSVLERGEQLVRERRPWPPPVANEIDIDASPARLAPWTGHATVAAPNVVAWPEDGGGDAVFELVELRTVDNGGTARLVRALAPRSATTDGGFQRQLALALPAGFEAYAFDPATTSTVRVSQYHFEPGVTYDRVRALADWNASPQNELGYGPDILYVAVAGLSL